MADPIEDFNTRWIVKEHIIPASYIRGFARGVRAESNGLVRLAVKQYVPRLTNSHPQPPTPGDPTVIFAHGVGSSKESYEPLIDALVFGGGGGDGTGLRVRAVWIPDVAWHGASYRLNEEVLGDEPHWDDSARDILQLVNHFQADMPAPILGVAQSWGAWALLRAAAWHPRLFAGLALMEPTLISSCPGAGMSGRRSFAYGMVFKRDAWASRAEARAYLRGNPYYGAFDGDVFERVMRYDLRDVADGSGGGGGGGGEGQGAVTLTTPTAMEVHTMMRPWPPLPGGDDDDDNPDHRLARLAAEGRYEPNMVIDGFHRDEPSLLGPALPDLLPPVQLVWAGRGFAMLHAYRAWLRGTIGTGKGGSGGGDQFVEEVVVEDSGHPLPLERPREAAAAVGPWLAARVRAWKEARDAERMIKSGGERRPYWTTKVNPVWVEKVSKL